MSIVESRLKKGTLTFGTTPGTPFACQATNVRVTPSYDEDGDALETLCGDAITAGQKESWVLAGTSIQDFDDPEGFLAYCYENAMTSQPFTWQPNITGAPSWAGNATIIALEEGGDVNTRLTSDWEFALAGRPARIYEGGTKLAVRGGGLDAGIAAAGNTTALDVPGPQDAPAGAPQDAAVDPSPSEPSSVVASDDASSSADDVAPPADAGP